MLRLSDAVVIAVDGNEFLFQTEMFRVKMHCKSSKLRNFILQLIMQKGVEESSLSSEELTICQRLMKIHILQPPLHVEDQQRLRNYRYFSYYSNDLSKIYDQLAKIKIFLLGIGGVGQIVLEHLAAAGIRDFILVDNDVVKKSDFNRQFLVEKAQIGMKKTKAVEQTMFRRFDDIRFVTIEQYIEDNEALDHLLSCYNPDMFICAADMPDDYIIRTLVVSSCLKYNVPCVFSGVGLECGEIGPILDNKTSMINYLESMKNLPRNIIHRVIPKGSICFTNTLVSVELAREIFEYFVKLHSTNIKGRKILWNLHLLEGGVREDFT